MIHATHSTIDSGVAYAAPLFRSVVCGVDGSRAGREAVRQATELAGSHAGLAFVAVTPAPGHPVFFPLPDAARAALADARKIALALGREATARTLSAASAATGLLRAAATADLLVVGCTEIETDHGVSLGRVTTPIVGRAPYSVLVARTPPDLPLCYSIVVPSDSDAAMLTAAQLALEHGSTVYAVAPEHIAASAAAIGSGLIVTGDGRGAQAVREADCSVLVVHEH